MALTRWCGLDGAGAAGAVVEFDHESLAQPALDVDSHCGGQANQLRGHQDLVLLVSHIAIRGQILTFCIGVDRHLGNLASTNRRDEVNRHDSAAFSEQLLGIRCDVDVHYSVSGSKAVRVRNPTNATPLPEPVEQFPLPHQIVGSYGVRTAPIWCQRWPSAAAEVPPHGYSYTHPPGAPQPASMTARRNRRKRVPKGQRDHRRHGCWDHQIVAALRVAYQANLGTLRRTCEAVGACMAVRKRIVVVELSDTATALTMLEAAREPTVLLLGHEANRVPDDIMQLADDTVQILMIGVGRSLNVTVAGSLVPYRLAGLS